MSRDGGAVAARGALGSSRARHRLEAERARRDAHWFLFESRHVVTKDEHDDRTPVKPLPDVAYLRGMLDTLLVAGKFVAPPDARHALAAGLDLGWLFHVAQSGVVLIEKSRQVLATWLVCGFALWRARRAPHQLVLIQSKREDDAAALVFVKEPEIARMSFMESHLPEHLRQTTFPRCGTWGKLLIEHPEGAWSQVWGIPEGGTIIRSNTPSLVVADEAAFQPEFGESYAASMPAIHGGGQYVALSSAAPGEFATMVGATTEVVA